MNAVLQEIDKTAVVDDPLCACLHIVTRLYGRPISMRALMAGIPLRGAGFTPSDFIRSAAFQGYSARVVRRELDKISDLLLPVTLLLRDGRAVVMTRRTTREQLEIVVPETGFGSKEVAVAELGAAYSGYAIFTQPILTQPQEQEESDVPVRERGWFWRSLLAYSPLYIEAIVAGILVNVLTVAGSLFVMNVYDRVVPNNAVETLMVLATGTAIAAGLEFLARTLRAYFLDIAGKKADEVISSTIFSHALGIRMSSRPPAAGVFAAQLREFESVRDFITSATMTAVIDLPFIAFFIAIVGLIGGPLYVVPLIAVPVVLLVGLVAQWPLAHATRAVQRDAAQRHGLLVESLEGAEILKAMRAEGTVLRRYEDYTAMAAKSSNQARFISTLVVNFAVLTQQLVTIGVVIWGVYLIADGDLTVGGLIASVMLTGRGLAPLQTVASLMMRYQQARSAYLTLDRLMKQPVERAPGQQFTRRDEMKGELSLVDVHFKYTGSATDSLTGVGFSVKTGEHVAILGRVGSGKSTLLRLITGLYPSTKGTVRIDGVDLAQMDPADYRSDIGYVPQEPMLFLGSLRDNIALGNRYADDGAILSAARIAGIDGMINQHPSGLQMHIGERGSTLSGGQRQAVANARAFLVQPKILLLDEPTSAMDNSAEARYIANLADFANGRTLVLVTHKPTMLSLVSRVIVIDGGRVVMDGPRDDVIRQLTRSVEPSPQV